MKPVKKDQAPFITDYKEYHTDSTVHFIVTMPEQNLELAQQQGIHKTFKLLGTISTTNMHLFDSDGLIRGTPRPRRSCRSFAASVSSFTREGRTPCWRTRRSR